MDPKERAALQVEKVVAAAEAAKTTIQEWAEGSRQWTSPCNFGELRDQLKSHLATLKKARFGMDNIKEMIGNSLASESTGRANEKKQWHGNVIKIAVYFQKVATGVPEALAKVWSEVVYNVAYPASQLNIPLVVVPLEVLEEVDACSTKDALFSEPK